LYDIAIVGGGPSGSQTAYRLSTMGYKVAVIDKKADMAGPVCCTGIVSEECIREFRIEPEAIYRHVNRAAIYSPSGKRLHVERSTPQAAILNRPLFNGFMAGRAQKQGVEYITDTRVIDIHNSPDTVTLVLSSQQKERIISSRLVVLACGVDIAPGQKANGTRPGNIVPGAQSEVISSTQEVEVYLGKDISPGFFAWLVPTAQGKALAGLLVRRQPAERQRNFLTWLADRGKIASPEVSINVGAVPLKYSSRTCGDRILVVGTAAGLVKPITGGGIYYGLLSADIAAEITRQAFAKNDFSSGTLAGYEEAWKKVLLQELRAGSRARSLYEHLNDTIINKSFDIMNKNGRIEHLLAQDDITFDKHSTAVSHLLQETTLAKLIKGVKSFLPGKHNRKNDDTREEN
jgi:digeranylgeranylglycerophospholipid reductase